LVLQLFDLFVDLFARLFAFNLVSSRNRLSDSSGSSLFNFIHHFSNRQACFSLVARTPKSK
jgi:hypothetical protein